MVQCEMCGAETGSPKTVKVEGAELDVCEDCTDFGTEVREDPSSSASTKYSTSSSDSGDSSGTTTRSSGGRSGGSSGGGSRGSEMMDDVEALATDYDERIRAAREDAGLSQEELAGELNEKASLIRKLERGDMLPSDDVQTKIERNLDISLAGGAGGEEGDWESDSEAGSYTLGDMVERKD
jgi:putative transcription factor